LSVHQIPFPYHKLKSTLPTILNKWYGEVDRLGTLYELYFGVNVNDSSPIDFQFITLIEAIESYHRETGLNKYASNANYKPTEDVLVKAIPPGIDRDFRESLKSKIHYGNEYSFIKRLNILLKKIPPKVRNIITDNDKNFAVKIKDTRNYLIHRDKSLKKDALDFKKQIHACESLKLLVTYLLLNGVGLDKQLIESELSAHWRYRRSTIF